MSAYAAPLRDLRFVLHELLDVCAEGDGSPAVASLDRDTLDKIL